MDPDTILTLYEKSVPGRRGIDLPEPDVPLADLPAAELRADCGLPELSAARGRAPLPRAVAAQFRRRFRILSARLLHHEIQSRRSTRRSHGCRLRRGPSAAGSRHGAGQPRGDVRAAALARRDRRLCRGVAAARRRRPGRVHRALDDPRLSPRARRGFAPSHPDPQFRPWHQSGLDNHGGLHRGRASVATRAATSISKRCAPPATKPSPA